MGAGIGVAATAATKSEAIMEDFILLSVELINDELVNRSVLLILESRNEGVCWIINSQTAELAYYPSGWVKVSKTTVRQPIPHPEGGSGVGAALITLSDLLSQQNTG